jgi:hypothetical protein
VEPKRGATIDISFKNESDAVVQVDFYDGVDRCTTPRSIERLQRGQEITRKFLVNKELTFSIASTGASENASGRAATGCVAMGSLHTNSLFRYRLIYRKSPGGCYLMSDRIVGTRATPEATFVQRTYRQPSFSADEGFCLPRQ